MNKILLIAIAMGVGIGSAQAAQDADDASSIERGRYLVTIGGCNDCHTAGYAERGGQVPESEWLTGVPVGFRGPWGTSYPSNLRLVATRMSEAQFLARARSNLLPPMPWFNLVAMSDEDLKSVYRFIASLGPAGVDQPPYVAPGALPETPFIEFVPTESVSAKVSAN